MDYNIKERPSDSPFVEKIWHTQTDSTGIFISQAAIHCELVVIKYNGKTTITLRGPETKARNLHGQLMDTEFFGITFKPATFVPKLPPKTLLDGSDVRLPEASKQSFWLGSSTWQIPNFENADTLVDSLVREGLLVCDPVVESVLQGHTPDLSVRSVQYRFVKATGLTQKTIEQIQRAHQAKNLLQQGISIPETVYKVGYFDQSHMTNSFKRFIGQLPSQIMNPSSEE